MATEENNPVLVVPDYERPAKKNTSDQDAAAAAAFFGGLPMGLGALSFLLWLPTRAPLFEFLAFLSLPLAVLCFFTGIVALLVHFGNIRGPRKFTRFLSTSWLAFVLLLANVPAAVSLGWLFSHFR
jgi:hypothetical protein